MNKIIYLIIIVVILVSGATAIEAGWPHPPRVGFKDVKIYAFYDTDTNILCYVTDAGGIDCFNSYEVKMEHIEKLIKIKRNNVQTEHENIIILP